MSLNRDMDKAIVELANAIDHHAICVGESGRARNAECAAINRVNEAQKRVDELVADMKKQSPRESDWRREKWATGMTTTPEAARLAEELRRYADLIEDEMVDGPKRCVGDAGDCAAPVMRQAADALAALSQPDEARAPTPDQYRRAHLYLRQREADLGAGELDELLSIFGLVPAMSKEQP